MLHVPHAVQTQRLPATGDVFDDSFPSRECNRVVRTDRGCMPTHFRVLESGACKVYQLSSLWRLDQPAAYCQRSCDPDLATASPVENAVEAHEEIGLDNHLPDRIYVSTRTLTQTIRRLIVSYSGIVGACIRLALYIHRLYVLQPGSSQTTSKLFPPPPREPSLRQKSQNRPLTAIPGPRRINRRRGHRLLRRTRHVPHRRLPASPTPPHHPAAHQAQRVILVPTRALLPIG